MARFVRTGTKHEVPVPRFKADAAQALSRMTLTPRQRPFQKKQAFEVMFSWPEKTAILSNVRKEFHLFHGSFQEVLGLADKVRSKNPAKYEGSTLSLRTIAPEFGKS